MTLNTNDKKLYLLIFIDKTISCKSTCDMSNSKNRPSLMLTEK